MLTILGLISLGLSSCSNLFFFSEKLVVTELEITAGQRTMSGLDRSKFSRIENEINLRFLLFSCFICYLSSRSLRSKRFRAVSEQRPREKWPLVSFLPRPKPRISFLGLSFLRNSTETLATQANRIAVYCSLRTQTYFRLSLVRWTSETRKYVCVRRLCVLRNFDGKSWWHATRAVVYNSRIETDIGIRPLPVTKLPNISTFISDFQFFMLGLWAPKRVIHHIHLTCQKRYLTEQKWIWPVIVTGDYPKIISSPEWGNSIVVFL